MSVCHAEWQIDFKIQFEVELNKRKLNWKIELLYGPIRSAYFVYTT